MKQYANPSFLFNWISSFNFFSKSFDDFCWEKKQGRKGLDAKRKTLYKFTQFGLIRQIFKREKLKIREIRRKKGLVLFTQNSLLLSQEFQLEEHHHQPKSFEHSQISMPPFHSEK